jgi:hypothetical protein
MFLAKRLFTGVIAQTVRQTAANDPDLPIKVVIAASVHSIPVCPNLLAFVAGMTEMPGVHMKSVTKRPDELIDKGSFRGRLHLDKKSADSNLHTASPPGSCAGD